MCLSKSVCQATMYLFELCCSSAVSADVRVVLLIHCVHVSPCESVYWTTMYLSELCWSSAVSADVRVVLLIHCVHVSLYESVYWIIIYLSELCWSWAVSADVDMRQHTAVKHHAVVNARPADNSEGSDCLHCSPAGW